MQVADTASGSAPAEPRAAGLLLRFASMMYEGMLLFGVVFVVSYAVLALTRWTYPLPPLPRLILQCVLFIVIGAYFVYQWSKTGQTLAMKSWRLKVIDREGRSPSARRALARYVVAWHLFLPGFLWTAAFGGNLAGDLVAYALGLLALLLPAARGPDRRLLHDRLTGTRIVRVP